MDPTLRQALERAVGAQHVLTDPALRATYETDWTRRWTGSAAAVVRPADTAQVASVVRSCNQAGVSVVPQGGNTGLVGGGVPRGGEIVLSLTRLNELGEVDDAGELTAGAGVTIARAQERARSAGWQLGVDFGARESATVGGAVATNAGGIRVLRYGTMRAQVRGLEAVLADGIVIGRMPGMVKDNTGLHLPSFLAGSEGTLAVITQVRLALVRPIGPTAVALVGLDDIGAAAMVAAQVRRSVAEVVAAEVFTHTGLDLVMSHTGVQRPLKKQHGAYLLLECAGDSALASLADSLDTVGASDVAAGDDIATCRRLWHLREALTESISGAGIPHKLDVAVPMTKIGELAARTPTVVAAVAPEARVVMFGHVGDGNLHINVLGPEARDESVDDAVLNLVIELGGSISAEHGIGVAKTRWLEANRGRANVAVMRAIKDALDPRGILNPGVQLPLSR